MTAKHSGAMEKASHKKPDFACPQKNPNFRKGEKQGAQVMILSQFQPDKDKTKLRLCVPETSCHPRQQGLIPWLRRQPGKQLYKDSQELRLLM